MDAAPSPPTFGQENFGTARLGDRRRTRRLVDLADRILRHPGGSLPDKFADPNALNRCYDLMKPAAVTHAALLEPHRRFTFQKMRAHNGVVLEIHDGTELDFTGHRSLHDQLGQIGNGHGRGYVCHNSLAVNPTDRSVFGLLNQLLHVRADVPAHETPQQKRERQSRESLLWLRGVDALEPAPAGKRWVDVCDCLSDTFEFFDHEERLGRNYVVRSWQQRKILVGHAPDGDPALLLPTLRGVPALAQRPLSLPARDGRPARDTVVSLAFVAVQLLVPRNRRGRYRGQSLAVWAIRVWEAEPPPAGAEPVEWLLLTNLPVATAAAAWEKVDWYTCRWVIEEYHKAQKSGCAIEAPQFTTADRLQPMIALLSVVAVALLRLRDLSRSEATQELPATEVVTPEYVEVLSGWRYQERRDLTIKEFLLALGRLGGHLNRKSDKTPGWLVLWRGWQKLHLMVEGARAAEQARSKPLRIRRNRSP